MVGNSKLDRKFYLRVSLIFYACWSVCFISVGKYAEALPTRDFTSVIDRFIPVCPVFIWPYELCYIFPFLPILVLRDWHRFNRAILAVIIACLSAFAVYFLLPVSFPRPKLGNSLSASLLGLEYAFDFYPGANKLPSLHVTYAWIVYLVCRGQAARRSGEAAILSVALLITISTVFVKQHIIIDSAAGIVWALGAWWLAGRLYPRLTDATAGPHAALKQMSKKILPLTVVFLVVLFLAVDFHWERLLKW